MRWMQVTPDISILILHDFDGEIRHKILQAKYHNQRGCLHEFAREIAEHLQQIYLDSGVVVTWAPTSDSRRRVRGVDQSEILARHVGAFLKQPTKHLLRKVTQASQTGAPRAQRLSQVKFVARVPSDVTAVIVIDDVVTTGATMMAATRALHAHGVHDVLCVAVAGTRVTGEPEQ
jgi:ComF family protein